MKGKSVFTKNEEKEIRSLISNLVGTSREVQKIIRRKLRDDFDFYISRFTSSKKGFTLEDFNAFKKTGEIRIKEV